MKNKAENEGHSKNGLNKVTTWQNGNREVTMMTEEELAGLKRRKFDACFDFVHGCSYVRKRSGKLIIHDGTLRGHESSDTALLLKLMKFPGRGLRPYEIGRLDPQYDSHYIKDCVIQVVRRLRVNVFGESGKKPYFLLTQTKPYAMAYNGKLSFCLIQRPDGHIKDE